jgi:predicted nucleotidyltransferase
MNLQELNDSGNIIFSVISGSHAYGLNVPTSDEDIRGIFFNKPEVSLDVPSNQIMDNKNDIVYYSIEEFFKLAMNASPNMVELLWMPEENYTHPAMQLLYQNREKFLTQKCLHSFGGYAHAQIKKAKGQNKWINNPQPEEPPQALDHLYYIPVGKYANCKPAPMVQTKGYIVSKMEHTPNMYRMYRGDSKDDFFKGNQIHCSSVPVDQENQVHGLALFNENAYKEALTKHKQYWEWRKNRNEARWVDQEKGLLDYDAKNMMHCTRLLMSGNSIARGQGPIVKFTGGKQRRLLEIRSGTLKYEEIMNDVEYLKDELDRYRDTTELPKSVNYKEMNKLYKEVMGLCLEK